MLSMVRAESQISLLLASQPLMSIILPLFHSPTRRESPEVEEVLSVLLVTGAAQGLLCELEQVVFLEEQQLEAFLQAALGGRPIGTAVGAGGVGRDSID